MKPLFLIFLAAALLLPNMAAAAAEPGVPTAAPSVAVAPSPAPATTSQLITVSTPSAGATVGTLSAWSKDVNGYWTRVLGPITAHVGNAGVGQASEGSSKTPAGTFALTEAFGRQANPGTAMPYFVADTNDWWNGNVASAGYNTHVRQDASPGGASENLYRAGAVYDYAVNIGYNLERTPGAGSAFFLHVSDGGPTAGCVSIDRGSLMTLLRWLEPGRHPQIEIRVGAEWTPDPAASADALRKDASASVKLMFASLLGRQADSAGLASWSSKIVSGQPFSSIAQQLANSGERTSRIVSDIYRRGLLRSPDVSGARYWTSKFSQGANYADVAGTILGSSEGVGRLGQGSLDRWAQQVFKFALGRDGSPQERAAWVNRAGTIGTVAAAIGILRSAEAGARHLDGLYRGMLGRKADSVARTKFAALMPGRGLFTVPGSIAASNEFKSRARAQFP